MAGIQEGDIIRLDLTGRVNSHEGPVFQTTVESVAREEGMIEEGKHAHYEPRLVIVGKKQLLDGVEEALIGMTVDEEKQIEVPAEKGFGDVDPKKRRAMAFREFKKNFKRPPRVGDVVEMPKSGEQARILRVEQGKVIIDTNHILAGRTLYYTIKVVEKMEGDDAKLNALIEQRLPGIHAHDLTITKESGILEIVLPLQVTFAQQFGLMVYMLGMELQREFPEYAKVRFVIEVEPPKMPEGEESEENKDVGNDKPSKDVSSDEADDAASEGGESPVSKVKEKKAPKKASKTAKGKKKATDTDSSDDSEEDNSG